MKRPITLFVIAVLIGAAALAGAFLCEKKGNARIIRPTLECTDEEILSLPYFRIVVAGGENRNLPCDVKSYSIGDGIIHLMLPEDVPEKALAVYFTDIDGNLLARRVLDMTQTNMIGPWEIRAEHHSLPIMYFNSDDPAVYTEMINRETKDIICDGDMHICVGDEDSKKFGWFREYISSSDDPAISSASLQGRGTSSWKSNTKRSFTLRLAKSENLLGMGKNKSWNLIGNAYDNSLLKNVVFNDISKEIGISYQPEMQNIDLYVDGEYQGVYTLTTKVSVGKNRIPLRKGDMFFKMDPPTATQPISYSSQTWFADGNDAPVADLLYPENATDDELREASRLLQDFIDAVEDPKSDKLEKICDIPSLAKYYWVEEASMNFDAWQRSVYVYYTHGDAQVHVGPVWDMDLALGSPYAKEGVHARFDTPDGWKIRMGGWYRKLFENERFRQAVSDEYFNGGVREALLDGMSDFENRKESLGSDAYMNFLLFGHSNDIGEQSVYGYSESYDDYYTAMTDFYKARIAWIDEEMSSSDSDLP